MSQTPLVKSKSFPTRTHSAKSYGSMEGFFATGPFDDDARDEGSRLIADWIEARAGG